MKLFIIICLTVGALALGWFGFKGDWKFFKSFAVMEQVLEKTTANIPGRPAETPSPFDSSAYHLPQSIHPRGLNLIFFSDGYLSWEEFDADIQILMRQIKTVEPWKSFSRYNVYQIRPKEFDICGVKTQDERKPVLRCDPEKINAYLSNLRMDNFKFVVLSRRDFQSWANVARLTNSGIFFSIPQSSKDDGSQEISGVHFLHLLGHAFGLKDEELFIIAKAGASVFEPDGPNCAPDIKTAQKWWGDLSKEHPERVGYFHGCSGKIEFVKPTEGSLMNLGDLADFVKDYGPVSEKYLKKVLNYCFSEKAYSKSDDPEFFSLYPEFRECVDK